jgi:hypothetical protein
MKHIQTFESFINEDVVNEGRTKFEEEVFVEMKDIAKRIDLNKELDKRHRSNNFKYLEDWTKSTEFKQDIRLALMNHMDPKSTAELVMKSLGYYDYE